MLPLKWQVNVRLPDFVPLYFLTRKELLSSDRQDAAFYFSFGL